MTRYRKALGTVLSTLAIGAAAATIPAAPAAASGGCSGSTITINSGSGAEAPSRRYGHGHATGNHYIRSVTYLGSGRIVTWYADNNGGWDGDTTDSYYTDTFCA